MRGGLWKGVILVWHLNLAVFWHLNLADTKKEAKRLKAITLKGAIEKRTIILSLYWKMNNRTIIISHFGGITDIFTNFNLIRQLLLTLCVRL